jgi:hypothetical protein
LLNMTTKDKKAFVRRVGLPVAANTSHAHAAAQQQPAAQQPPAAHATEVATTAGSPVPGHKPGAILRTMLSANVLQRGRAPAGSTASVTFEGHTYSCRVTKVKCTVNSDITSESLGYLMDSGANGGVTGEEMLSISIVEHSKVDISGVGDNIVIDLALYQGASVITMEGGREIVAIFYQYANLGKGISIHSVAQLESIGMQVNARSKYLGGTKPLVTPEGHVIPLSVRDGLTQMDMQKPTETDMCALEHVFFTSDSPWDLTCIDNEATIVASEDTSDVPAFLENEDLEAIDSLHFEEYVDQCFVHI